MPCHDGAVPAAREEQIAVVEALVGLHFPAEQRRLLLEQDGWSTTYGTTYVQFFGVEQIREQYLIVLHEGPAELIDFVPFASDGSRERIGYDRRVHPSPVVMLDITAEDWSSAMLQGTSFGGFLGRLQAGKGLDFSTGYAAPAM